MSIVIFRLVSSREVVYFRMRGYDMPWNKDKILLQLQVTPEHKAELRKMAEADRRSLAGECLYLIDLGMRVRDATVKRQSRST